MHAAALIRRAGQNASSIDFDTGDADLGLIGRRGKFASTSLSITVALNRPPSIFKTIRSGKQGPPPTDLGGIRLGPR
jgi:hypothetical protein